MTQPAITEAEVRHFIWMESPLGRLLLSGTELGLAGLHIHTDQRPATIDPDAVEDPSLFRDAIKQLQAYFAGELRQFDLKLNPHGTPFQQRAWEALRQIPYGETISYGEQAKRMGDANASRAVGGANGANPIPIIIPCHRVVGSSGKLTGFTAGLPIKAWLLHHEAGLLVPGG
jgi:methylated-DNA-[protein]-cysteine S-methyltransferase